MAEPSVIVRRDALLRFAILFVFLKLDFRFQKQFFKHVPLARIDRDLEHCPEVLNVLSSDKAIHGSLRSAAATPIQLCARPMCHYAPQTTRCQ
jgi:hypothetical protein